MRTIRALSLISLFLLAGWIVSLKQRAGAQIPISKEMSEAIRPVTTEEEILIGRDVAANVIAQFGLYEDELLTDYVNMVGLTVSRAAPRQDLVYRFAILNSGVVNALAVPGGYIFITRGLLDMLENEAQLASVLGHEVAHVSQRHVAKEIQKQRIAQARIPKYIKATAEKAEWMSQITDLAIVMIWKGLSREDEIESDRLGIEFSTRVGYEALSYKVVLEKLRARAQAADKDENRKDMKFLLSTHPRPEDRIQALEESLKTVSAKGVRLEERFGKSVGPR